MGYATILSGGPDGRYTIQLDYGEATRTALIAAFNAGIAELTVKIAAAQLKVTQAEEKEDAQRALVTQAQEDYINAATSLPPGSPKPSTAAIQFGMQELKKMQLAHEGLRRILALLKFDLVAAQQRLNYWTEFNPVETRSAWCADLTEDAAAGQTVATVDIPGESNLLLIAPGARGWMPGDGTVKTEVKAAQLLSLNARQDKLLADKDVAEAKQTTILAEEAALVAEQTLAQSVFAATGAEADRRAVEEVAAKLTTKRAELQRVREKIAAIKVALVPIQKDIARWSAKPASDTPNAGDGVLTARELMSPEQVFYNAAILPGWQKFMPTYRWGSITRLDYDANVADVSLADAVSSAQSLSVNKVSALSDVPVVYMSCNAQPFEVGDNVVVQFVGQDWANPRVIGFLNDPKPCVSFTLRYKFQGLSPVPDDIVQTIYLHRDGDPVTAPTPVLNISYTFTPPLFFGGAGIWLGWDDGTPDLLRQELDVTADLETTAQYGGISGFEVSVTTSTQDSGTGLWTKTLAVIYPETNFSFVSGLPQGLNTSPPLPAGDCNAWPGPLRSVYAVTFPGGKTVLATYYFLPNPNDSSTPIKGRGAFILESVSTQYPT